MRVIAAAVGQQQNASVARASLDRRGYDCDFSSCRRMAARLVPRQRRSRIGLRVSQFSYHIITVGYYSSQILLFGAEFTQAYAGRAGREGKPDEYAVRVQTKEVETA